METANITILDYSCADGSGNTNSDTENLLTVLCDGKAIGEIELYDNAFHKQNQYIRLRLSYYYNTF